MSRVANNPVVLPPSVEVRFDGQEVSAKGKQGELSLNVHVNIGVEQSENHLRIVARDNSKKTKALSGTMRALLANLVQGVDQGFEKKLELRGVGYRAQLQGRNLNLTLGYSHPVVYVLPEGINANVATQTEVVISGVDKQQVGQVAAEIRALRPPEHYKGKGVRYADEYVQIKETKKK